MAKEITREMVAGYKAVADTAKGTSYYAIFNLEHQWRDSNGRWHFLRMDTPMPCGGKWEIKVVKGNTYLVNTYLRDGSAERWILSDLAKKYFTGDGAINAQKYWAI